MIRDVTKHKDEMNKKIAFKVENLMLHSKDYFDKFPELKTNDNYKELMLVLHTLSSFYEVVHLSNLMSNSNKEKYFDDLGLVHSIIRTVMERIKGD